MPEGREWTPEEIAKEKAKRVEYIKTTGRCPEGGGKLKLDRPEADAPPGRLTCGFQCDCFGFDPNKPFEEQV